MHKDKNTRDASPSGLVGLNLSATAEPLGNGQTGLLTRAAKHRATAAAFALLFVIGLGVMAKNIWFGPAVPGAGATGSNPWSLFAAPPTSPTPQLTREYIYAGSKLLAVEDRNANDYLHADLALWRPLTGIWYVLTSVEGVKKTQLTFQWGVPGDVPAVGDYDGDGKTDFCIYRNTNATWYTVDSSDGSYHYPVFGAPCTPPTGCDIPAPADYDGDGKTDVAVWRPSTGVWHIVQSSNGSPVNTAFGLSGDKPVPHDFDGDGRADLAVWRHLDHSFYLLTGTNGSYQIIPHGSPGDRPACGDYDGDGKSDYAVFRDADATWRIRQSSDSQLTQVAFGASGDDLVPNDYDGDGKVDMAVWRSSTGVWYIKKSGNGQTRQETWGLTGDIPTPAYYRR